MNIRPIETTYAGVRFRSRLEARWAVFFETLGISWQYELEGFELPSGRRYLPDFFLPCIGWMEIKPAKCEDDRWVEFSNSANRLYVAFGIPGEIEVYKGGDWDHCQAFCVCPCGKPGIAFDGDWTRICDKHSEWSGDGSRRIAAAFSMATSMRFERHGAGR